jgi:hypothetical protein
MITLISAIALQTTNLPHVSIASFFQAKQPTVERYLGTAYKQRRGPGYVFKVKGFDQFWVSGFGTDMNGLACQLSSTCSREAALGCLGISDKHATIQEQPLGPTAIATRRNVFVITGITGMPNDAKSNKPWKVHYEEVGVLNEARRAALRPQIESATGAARINLIKQCYDWRPSINIGH